MTFSTRWLMVLYTGSYGRLESQSKHFFWSCSGAREGQRGGSEVRGRKPRSLTDLQVADDAVRLLPPHAARGRGLQALLAPHQQVARGRVAAALGAAVAVVGALAGGSSQHWRGGRQEVGYNQTGSGIAIVGRERSRSQAYERRQGSVDLLRAAGVTFTQRMTRSIPSAQRGTSQVSNRHTAGHKHDAPTTVRPTDEAAALHRGTGRRSLATQNTPGHLSGGLFGCLSGRGPEVVPLSSA
ncbi:hypothetical protein EYF80_064408 [Liparis tanakae]|uniref:Uncharacterized protein n=1 Tax=Liparis tanakae TaxID=230148 RepID=A0A4Z2E9M6_9TELE|nr:hypothetical protein EYF80_064408 [Liparis tanakae]